jgi:hypothetical protein
MIGLPISVQFAIGLSVGYPTQEGITQPFGAEIAQWNLIQKRRMLDKKVNYRYLTGK